jgi:hypothetical protein
MYVDGNNFEGRLEGPWMEKGKLARRDSALMRVIYCDFWIAKQKNEDPHLRSTFSCLHHL